MKDKVTIFHNPRCSKSREGLNFLKESSCEIEIIEYLKDTPSIIELTKIISLLGIKPEALIRKGEEEYTQYCKDKSLTDNEWITMMVKYPKLIERPIIIRGNKAVIGRPISRVIDLIK